MAMAVSMDNSFALTVSADHLAVRYNLGGTTIAVRHFSSIEGAITDTVQSPHPESQTGVKFNPVIQLIPDRKWRTILRLRLPQNRFPTPNSARSSQAMRRLQFVMTEGCAL
jgi:hypothetical protein